MEVSMKRLKMQAKFSFLPAVILTLGLIAGSSAELSLPASARAAQDPGRGAGAPAASKESQSSQEANRLAQLEQKIAALQEKLKESGKENGVVRVIIGLRGDFQAEDKQTGLRNL